MESMGYERPWSLSGSLMAFRMSLATRLTFRLVGLYPSLPFSAPRTTAWILAFLARAESSLSSTTTPPPAARTNPSRSLSNGRLAFSGSSLRVESGPLMAAKMEIESSGRSVSVSSTPPAKTIEFFPDFMSW